MPQRMLILAFVGLSLCGLTCAPQAETTKKTTEITPPKKTDPSPPLSKDAQHLAKRIGDVLDDAYKRELLTTHAFWTIFHGILGLGPDLKLLDPNTNERIRALDRIAQGKGIRGLSFLEMPHGLDVETMAGSGVGQGHQDQFVAEMAQWGMPLSFPFQVNGKDYTFQDFVRHSKARTSTTRNQELSWAIVIISQYYGTRHQWSNFYGDKLTLEDVVQYELDQPIQKAACGGTHRLFGLTWAYHIHLRDGGQSEGVWRRTGEKIAEYKEKARKFQNPDGSFSSDYVSSPGYTPNIESRIGTTGHVLEWLALAMTQEELKQEWVERAAYALTSMILDSRDNPVEGGALYHAIHGLHIYRQRVFGVPGPRGLTIPLPPGWK